MYPDDVTGPLRGVLNCISGIQTAAESQLESLTNISQQLSQLYQQLYQAELTGQSVPEIQETANLQVLSLQRSLFSSAAYWQGLAGQGDTEDESAVPC